VHWQARQGDRMVVVAVVLRVSIGGAFRKAAVSGRVLGAIGWMWTREREQGVRRTQRGCGCHVVAPALQPWTATSSENHLSQAVIDLAWHGSQLTPWQVPN
jgi:hypothetical protein